MKNDRPHPRWGNASNIEPGRVSPNILLSPEQEARRHRVIHEYFIAASRPFYAMLEDIELQCVTLRMTVSKGGHPASIEKLYDERVITLIQTIDEAIEQCRALAISAADSEFTP